jgi:hypothetical protein
MIVGNLAKEPLSVAAEDPVDIFNLLGCLGGSLVELFMRSSASLTADIPIGSSVPHATLGRPLPVGSMGTGDKM